MTDYDEKPFTKSKIRNIRSCRKKIPFVFTPIPRSFYEWSLHLPLPQIRVYIYICIRTWGFSKEWDAISIQQFSTGITTIEGKVLDHGTGLKETAIRSAFHSLESKGLIEIIYRKAKPHLFRLTNLPYTPAEKPSEKAASA